MNHEEVIKAFGERKLNSKTKTVKWTGHHVYCEGDFLYSYGSHFLLAKHLGDNLFVVNSDGYSVSTSRHQGLTRQYCPGPILSNCLLRKEKFSLHDLLHKDILFYIRDQWHWCVKDIETNVYYDNYSYDEQFGSTLTDEYEPPALGVFKSRRKPFNNHPHFLEGGWVVTATTVFKKNRKVFLYSSDKEGRFVVRLPQLPESLEQAVEMSPRKPQYWK